MTKRHKTMDLWDKLADLATKNEMAHSIPNVRPCEDCTEQECRCFSVFDADRLEAQLNHVKSAQNQLCNSCGIYRAQRNSLKCISCNGVLEYQKAWLFKNGIISVTYNSDEDKFLRNHPYNKK